MFPALAVAETLPADWELHWLGVPDRMENELVPSNIPLYTVRAGGLQGRGLRQVINLVRLTLSTLHVARLIKMQGIEMVFSTGGYIAAPAILAGRWCKIPVILHESNGVPGRVTRLLGRLCDQVAVGLDQAAIRLPNCNTKITGTPVRGAFLKPAKLPTWVPAGPGPLLLVMGGSQGAVGLNRMIRPVLERLLASGCRIVHLCGCNDSEMGKISHTRYVELSFSDEMAGLMQHADLVISRAGAGTISELLACGCPAILVPYPQATDHHQEVNACAIAARGAAVMVRENSLDNSSLETTIWRMIGPKLRGCEGNNPLTLLKANASKLRQAEAANKVSKLLEETASWESRKSKNRKGI